MQGNQWFTYHQLPVQRSFTNALSGIGGAFGQAYPPSGMRPKEIYVTQNNAQTFNAAKLMDGPTSGTSTGYQPTEHRRADAPDWADH